MTLYREAPEVKRIADLLIPQAQGQDHRPAGSGVAAVSLTGWLRRAVPQDLPRRWFRDKDGTFYRNCPLVLKESREAIDAGRWEVATRLHAEFDEVFREGLIRKPALEPGDVEVRPVPFREAYPDKPELWVLDE